MSEQKDLASESKPLAEKTDAELKREARARLRRLDPVAAAAVADEVVSKRLTGSLAGFIGFVRERAVVGLAIGFVIGTQVQTVMKQFISSVIDPLFQLILPGNEVLSAHTWTVHIDDRTATFAWGALVYALLDFLFIVLVIYAVIRLLKLDRLDKK